jgi:hypothetical protein
MATKKAANRFNSSLENGEQEMNETYKRMALILNEMVNPQLLTKRNDSQSIEDALPPKKPGLVQGWVKDYLLNKSGLARKARRFARKHRTNIPGKPATSAPMPGEEALGKNIERMEAEKVKRERQNPYWFARGK